MLCRNGTTAAELVTTLDAKGWMPSANMPEDSAECRDHVAIGYMRTFQSYCPTKGRPPCQFGKGGPNFKNPNSKRDEVIVDKYNGCAGGEGGARPRGYDDASHNNTFFVLCRPEIENGDATVVVDGAGLCRNQPKTSPLTKIKALKRSPGISRTVSQSS